MEGYKLWTFRPRRPSSAEETDSSTDKGLRVRNVPIKYKFIPMLCILLIDFHSFEGIATNIRTFHQHRMSGVQWSLGLLA